MQLDFIGGVHAGQNARKPSEIRAASISTHSIGSVGRSGQVARLTEKCFYLATGFTAVILLDHRLATIDHRHGEVVAVYVL
jgi:hypothetical protein